MDTEKPGTSLLGCYFSSRGHSILIWSVILWQNFLTFCGRIDIFTRAGWCGQLLCVAFILFLLATVSERRILRYIWPSDFLNFAIEENISLLACPGCLLSISDPWTFVKNGKKPSATWPWFQWFVFWNISKHWSIIEAIQKHLISWLETISLKFPSQTVLCNISMIVTHQWFSSDSYCSALQLFPAKAETLGYFSGPGHHFCRLSRERFSL